MLSDGAIIRFKRFLKSCARLQLFSFHSFSLYAMAVLGQMRTTFLQFTITSDDLTSPSHYMIDLSTVGEDIQFRNISSQYTLRLFSLGSTFTQVESLRAGVWDAEAYTAQISVHCPLLTHAAGLVLQVEDGKMPPICTIEHHKKVHIFFQDIYLAGPCA